MYTRKETFRSPLYYMQLPCSSTIVLCSFFAASRPSEYFIKIFGLLVYFPFTVFNTLEISFSSNYWLSTSVGIKVWYYTVLLQILFDGLMLMFHVLFDSPKRHELCAFIEGVWSVLRAFMKIVCTHDEK